MQKVGALRSVTAVYRPLSIFVSSQTAATITSQLFRPTFSPGPKANKSSHRQTSAGSLPDAHLGSGGRRHVPFGLGALEGTCEIKHRSEKLRNVMRSISFSVTHLSCSILGFCVYTAIWPKVLTTGFALPCGFHVLLCVRKRTSRHVQWRRTARCPPVCT